MNFNSNNTNHGDPKGSLVPRLLHSFSVMQLFDCIMESHSSFLQPKCWRPKGWRQKGCRQGSWEQGYPIEVKIESGFIYEKCLETRLSLTFVQCLWVEMVLPDTQLDMCSVSSQVRLGSWMIGTTGLLLEHNCCAHAPWPC